MQPILVISPGPQLAESCRGTLPVGMFQVFHEADWLQALMLAAYRPFSAILVDLSNDQVDPFMIGRILWLRTRRPIMFVDGSTDLSQLVEAAVSVNGMLETTALRSDQEGWMPLVGEDIAASKRTATCPPATADLVRKAIRRFG